jgi:hypothetical protein
MPDRLVITEDNQLKEVSIPETISQPGWLKVSANILSIIFHPLFIPVYLAYFIVNLRAYQFASLDEWAELRIILRVVVTCSFLPLVSLLLIRALKFIDSIYLRTQKDRIIPYVICMIFYFWNWYAFKNTQEAKDLVSMSMAIFNACVFGFLMNISMKVSMHAIAMGVMTTFIALLAFTDTVSYSFYLCIAILIAGVVCTSRMIVSDHRPKEIYYGFAIGIFSQLAAHYFVYA